MPGRDSGCEGPRAEITIGMTPMLGDCFKGILITAILGFAFVGVATVVPECAWEKVPEKLEPARRYLANKGIISCRFSDNPNRDPKSGRLFADHAAASGGKCSECERYDEPGADSFPEPEDALEEGNPEDHGLVCEGGVCHIRNSRNKGTLPSRKDAPDSLKSRLEGRDTTEKERFTPCRTEDQDPNADTPVEEEFASADMEVGDPDPLENPEFDMRIAERIARRSNRRGESADGTGRNLADPLRDTFGMDTLPNLQFEPSVDLLAGIPAPPVQNAPIQSAPVQAALPGSGMARGQVQDSSPADARNASTPDNSNIRQSAFDNAGAASVDAYSQSHLKLRRYESENSEAANIAPSNTPITDPGIQPMDTCLSNAGALPNPPVQDAEADGDSPQNAMLAGSTPSKAELHELVEDTVSLSEGAGSMASAFLRLNRVYNQYGKDLSEDDLEALNQALDRMAYHVFYEPGNHILCREYKVSGQETLASIAAKYKVTSEFLAAINSMRQKPDEPLPQGKAIKVVEGPVSADVSFSKMELLLKFNGLYAGRFKMGYAERAANVRGEFPVARKIRNPEYNGPLDNGQVGHIASGDPRNPLGPCWIELEGGLGLQGTSHDEYIGRRNATVGGLMFSNKDISHLNILLAQGSVVRVLD